MIRIAFVLLLFCGCGNEDVFNAKLRGRTRMATKIWVGTTGAWSTAGNWSPSGVPVVDDDVIFRDNSQSVTTGLDQSALVGALDSLTIESTYTGNIGASGNPLIIDSDFVFNRSGGDEFWLKGDAVGSVVVLETNIAAENVFVVDGAQVRGYVYSGRMTLSATALFSGAITVLSTGGNLVPILIYNSGAESAGLILYDGLVESNTGTITGASFVHGGEFVHNGGTVTSLDCAGGVTYYDNGSILGLTSIGGLLDATRTTATRNITLLIMAGPGEVDFRGSGVLPGTIQRYTNSGILHEDH